MAGGLVLLSSIIGWLYVILWVRAPPRSGATGLGSAQPPEAQNTILTDQSVSLYPPVLLNRRLKSVEGMSVDFVILNAVGYLTYAFSLTLLYFSVVVRNEYAQRHSLSSSGELKFPLVRFNDVVYAYHGLAVVAYTVYQLYWAGYTRHHRQEIGRLTKYLLISGTFASIGMICYALAIQSHTVTNPYHLQMLDVATILGNVKVVMSAFKYIPQVLYNHKRRSTKGWSMSAVRYDIVGSLLSLCQLLLDAYIRNDMSGIWNNSVKLALATVSVFCLRRPGAARTRCSAEC